MVENIFGEMRVKQSNDLKKGVKVVDSERKKWRYYDAAPSIN
jgi:hypothetical protein